jgi:hypothetical protein
MKLLLALIIFLFLYMILQSPPISLGSGGLDPDGGMRNAKMYPVELYNGNPTYNDYEPYIYDHSDIPEPVVFPIGHWST